MTVVHEWERAAEERRPPNLDKFTGKYIDKYCAKTAAESPEWPAILYATDLSRHAAEQAPELQWWVPHSDGRGESGA